MVTILRNEADEPHGFATVLRDLTARKNAKDALQSSEERFRRIVESVRDHALFQVDPEGRVTFWNKGAEDLFGYGQDEILGRHVAILYTSDDQELSAKPNENERWMVRRDGARIFACGVTQPLLGSGGEVRGFVKVLRDDSERRRSEERRSRNERQEHHRVLGEVEHTEAALARTQDDLRALAARLMTAY